MVKALAVCVGVCGNQTTGGTTGGGCGQWHKAQLRGLHVCSTVKPWLSEQLCSQNSVLCSDK